MTELLARLARWTLASPRSVVAVLVALSLLAAALLPRLEFEPDVSKLLPESSDTIRLARRLEEATGQSRTLIIDLRGPELAAQMPAIADALRASPCLDEVQATREEFLGERAEVYRQAPLYYLPEQTLDRLEQRILHERDEALAEAVDELATELSAVETLSRDPLGLRWILEEGASSTLPLPLAPGSPFMVLESGERAIIRAKGARVPYDIGFSRELLADVGERLDAFELEWQLFGDYVFARSDSDRIQRDLGASALTSIILIGAFLVLTMRRLFDPPLVFFPVVIGIFWALPIGGALLGPLTGLTVSSAAILAGLGVDFTIHYLVRYSAERERHHHPGAVLRTLRRIGMPLVASALTTMAAFLSLTLADFKGIRVFGVLLAVGLGLVFLAAFLLLPLVLGKLPRRRGGRSSRSWVVLGVERLNASRAGAPVCALTLIAVVAGFVLVLTRGIGFATDLQYLRPPEDRWMQVRRSFEQELGFGLMPAAVFLPESMSDERLRDGLEQLERDGDWGLVLGPHQLRPDPDRIDRVAALREAIAGWTTQTRADLEEYGFDAAMFEAGLADFDQAFQSPPPEELPVLAVPWEGERREVLLLHPRVILEDLGEWLRRRDEIHDALGPEVKTFQAYDLLGEIHGLLVYDLLRAALVTTAVSILLAAWLSGGLRIGLLAMLPSLAGLGLSLGVMSWTDSRLNMGNVVCIPFLLGIGVDQGIHIVSHFRRTRGCGLGTCGTAVWRSSMTTVLGFGSLVVAETPAIASMGLIAILGVLASTATAMLALPVLWRRFMLPSVPAGPRPALDEAASSPDHDPSEISR